MEVLVISGANQDFEMSEFFMHVNHKYPPMILNPSYLYTFSFIKNIFLKQIMKTFIHFSKNIFISFIISLYIGMTIKNEIPNENMVKQSTLHGG